MSDIVSYKDAENKIHEELYNNLYLLKNIYTTTLNFNRVFKKYMFAKSNKDGFFEVIYYLLNILNPILTKERLTTWPPFDIKTENKFRTEVLNYMKELNNLYHHANIPQMMASHLISPGGYKFTKFMFKLSQLVIYEHLKKTHEVELLYYPEANENEDVIKVLMNNFQTITSGIEFKTKKKLDQLHEYHKTQEEKALSIVNTLSQLDKSVSVSKKEKAIAEEKFYKKYTVYPSDDSLKNKLVTLNQQWQNLAHIHTLYGDCKQLLSYINNTNLVIDIEDKTNCKEQNLSDFFNTLTLLINSKSLELPNPTNSYIQQNSEKICELLHKNTTILKEISVNIQQTQLLIRDTYESVRFVEHLIANQPKPEDFLDDMQGIKLLELGCD